MLELNIILWITKDQDVLLDMEQHYIDILSKPRIRQIKTPGIKTTIQRSIKKNGTRALDSNKIKKKWHPDIRNRGNTNNMKSPNNENLNDRIRDSIIDGIKHKSTKDILMRAK